MKPMTDFLKRIRIRAPGVAEPVAIDSIRQAAIRFCQRTRLWRDVDTFTVWDQLEYPVAPEGSQIFEIESATVDGEPINPISISELDKRQPDWRNADAGTHPNWITQTEPDTIRLVPHVADKVLSIALILEPTQEAVEVPDWMVNHYLRVIADGALGDILAIPGQSFTNPDQALFHSNLFESKLNELFRTGQRGQQRAPVRTKSHWF